MDRLTFVDVVLGVWIPKLTCVLQLNELNQFRSSGVITEDEYFEEKESVMRKMKGN